MNTKAALALVKAMLRMKKGKGKPEAVMVVIPDE